MRKYKLFKIFGIEINADMSWLIIVALLLYSLIFGEFPRIYPGLKISIYSLMGLFATIGFFASIIIHELCHSLVGIHFKMRIKEISLFVFGGVAHLEEEPNSPFSEFLMAIAGPAASVLLSVLFFVTFTMAVEYRWPLILQGIFSYLYQINFILAVFNMLPAFPLDGGRVLRSILWGIKKNVFWATRIASLFGIAIGFVLIFLGVYAVLRISIFGVWYIFIGYLIQQMAKASYGQLILKKVLGDTDLSYFVDTHPRVMLPDMKVQEVVSLYGQGEGDIIPVVDKFNSLQGFIDLKQIYSLENPAKDTRDISSIYQKCTDKMVINKFTFAFDAISKMLKNNVKQLFVVSHGKLIGVVYLSALIRTMNSGHIVPSTR